MILASKADLKTGLDTIGLGVTLERHNTALIKINLSHPPEPGHPRTDPVLLTSLIQYVSNKGAHCAIAEAANGFLMENVRQIGLDQVVKEHHLSVIDLDLEDYDCVMIEDEAHYLPKCLKNYAIRIGVPALSKRPGMIFSNNVKLFVGVVPRCMYQTGEPTAPRPRVHVDLHRSIANIYRAVMTYAPFDFFINGGRMMIDGLGEMDAKEILIGDDALEMDLYRLKQFNLEVPDYITRLTKLGELHNASLF